jgi:hypothetical protein
LAFLACGARGGVVRVGGGDVVGHTDGTFPDMACA